MTSVKQWNEEQESSIFSGMKLERMYRDNKGYKYEKDASSKRKEGSTCRHTGVTLWYGLMECPLTWVGQLEKLSSISVNKIRGTQND